MCQKRNHTKVWIPHQKRFVRIDKCLVDEIKRLNGEGFKTLGSCCGHKKYPPTIIAKSSSGRNYEWVSNKIILRIKRFYVKDKKGFYFIPECNNHGSNLAKHNNLLKTV